MITRFFALALALLFAAPAIAAPAGLEKIEHILVIYLENRSFDNLFGEFPGANGLSNAGPAAIQVDLSGQPYKTLPPAVNTSLKPPAVDTRFPLNLPNMPFAIDQYVPIDQKTGDLWHLFYQEQMQINGGKMNMFAAASNAFGLAMGYYDGSKTELWDYAKRYVLADNFFHAAFGGSFLNHFWLICACTPKFPDAPPGMVAVVGANGWLIKDGQVTPDGYAVNTTQPIDKPYSASASDPNKRLPHQDMATIGDRLSAKQVSWAWYSGGWNDAIAGHPHALFQYHHQPFGYFKKYADGTPGRAEHLKDEADMMKAIVDGTLPAVAFYKPLGPENEHPGYADVMTGDRKTVEVLRAVEASPLWAATAIIVTYDENGGQWDHVAPPKGDRWGPGSRVPTLIISPFAKKGFVDHTEYDTTSILKFIEVRFGLKPLGPRDAKANDFTNAFQF